MLLSHIRPAERGRARLPGSRAATLAVLSLFLMARPVQGQDAGVRVVDPALALNTAHLSEGTTRWRVTLLRDSVEKELGIMTSTTQFVSHEGHPAVLLTRTFPGPRGDIVDSALSFRRTLAPIWQRSHQPTKTMRLAFSDTAVTGWWAPTDSAARAVHHPTSRPVFDATSQALLIQSLPWSEGYRVLLPMYSFELGGMELDTARVVGLERVATPAGVMRDAWKIRFGDPFITATFWVDRDTRRILREDIVSRRNGALFREVPLPAAELRLSTRRPADGVRHFEIFIADTGGAMRPYGTMVAEQRTVTSGDTAVVRRVIRYDYPGRGSVVDTTLAVAATLAPISERTYKRAGLLRLDFAGNVVTGEEPVADSAPRVFRDSMATAPFNSTDLDLIARSVPLQDGYRAAVPLYDREYGNFRIATLTVGGTTDIRLPIGLRRARIVRVDDASMRSRYYVDPESRAMLRADVEVRAGGKRIVYRIVATE